MGPKVGRKRQHGRIRDVKRASRTRARTKDLDQIQEDMAYPERLEKEQKILKELDEDLPGGGNHYCIHCAKHFVSDLALQAHLNTKVHKKRVKVLKVPAYTQKEAEAAVGLGRASTRPSTTEEAMVVQ
ncbi:bud site selection-related protein [Cladochytrium replicatum]|nr:bud site selection-related protein [Cladochytrium replicatum]